MSPINGWGRVGWCWVIVGLPIRIMSSSTHITTHLRKISAGSTSATPPPDSMLKRNLYTEPPFGRRLTNTRPMPVRHAARARISGTARHGCITRATYMQLMLWFETRSIPQSRLEQADQDLRAAPALSREFSAHLPGSGPGVCESEKTTRERRARVRWEVRAARTGAADLERITARHRNRTFAAALRP